MKSSIIFISETQFSYCNKLYSVEELKEYYIIQNHLKTEVMNYFGLTLGILNKILSYYKLGKPTNLRNKNVAKYTDKKATILKAKQTNLKKYGVENVFAAEEIKEKIKNTNLEKYGVVYATHIPNHDKKTKLTNLKKYGTE